MKNRLNELLDIAYENNKFLRANNYIDKSLYINIIENVRLLDIVG